MYSDRWLFYDRLWLIIQKNKRQIEEYKTYLYFTFPPRPSKQSDNQENIIRKTDNQVRCGVDRFNKNVIGMWDKVE